MKHQKPGIHRYIRSGSGSPPSIIFGLLVMVAVAAGGAYLIHRSSASGGGGPLIYMDTNPAGVANACWDVQLSWDQANWADYGTRCTGSNGEYIMDSQYTYYKVTETSVPSGYSFSSWCLPNNNCTSNKTIIFSSSTEANQHIYMYLTPPPTPPTAPSLRVSGATSSSIGLAWSSGSPGSYGSISRYQVQRNNANLSTTSPGVTTFTNTGLGCGQSYSYAVILVTSSGVTAKSNTVSGTTSACSSGSTSTSSGSTSKTSGSTLSTGSTSNSSTASNLQPNAGRGAVSATAPSGPPAVPTGLQASLQSAKIITLSWQPDTSSLGLQYELSRSDDQKTWVLLTTSSDTSYTDTDTDFTHTYYYRVRAIDASGAGSDYATTQVTTDKFVNTSLAVTSSDKLVTARFVAGTFDQPADCSISPSDQTLPGSGKEALLTGPYIISCVGQDGSVLDSFGKPANITMKLGNAADGYQNIGVHQLSDDTSWNAVKSSYNAKNRALMFTLADPQVFASFGTPQSSRTSLVVSLVLAGLGLGAAAFFLVRRRRGKGGGSGLGPLPAASPPGTSLPAPDNASAQLFSTALKKPDCTHLNMAHEVQPLSDGCQECQAAHMHWKALRICLTCGHVGCSDDSNGHARKHFEQTGHPLMMAYGDPGAGNIGWCYIDQTYI